MEKESEATCDKINQHDSNPWESEQQEHHFAAEL